MPRRVVVLDTNQIQSDWLLRGLAARVLRFMSFHNYLKVVVPPVVVEELVANHAHGKSKADRELKALNRERSRAGLPLLRDDAVAVDYRAFFAQFVDDSVSWEVADWPRVSHAEIVEWSLSGRAPFDGSDRGYRDALIWATVRDLAAAGHEVAFATRDRDFEGGRRGEQAVMPSGS